MYTHIHTFCTFMFQKKICGTSHVMENTRELKLKETYLQQKYQSDHIRGSQKYGVLLIWLNLENQLNFSLILWGLLFCVCCSYLQAGVNMAGRVPYLTFILHDIQGRNNAFLSNEGKLFYLAALSEFPSTFYQSEWDCSFASWTMVIYLSFKQFLTRRVDSHDWLRL